MKLQPSRSALLLTAASRCSEHSLHSLKACVGFPMMQQNKWVGNYLQVWAVYFVDFSLSLHLYPKPDSLYLLLEARLADSAD